MKERARQLKKAKREAKRENGHVWSSGKESIRGSQECTGGHEHICDNG